MIKIRASQINGCAYCIDMHTQEALKLGEKQRRIFALSAWKESPLFTEEERAILQLTEEVTMISKHGVSNETYNNVLKFYSENELAQIIMQVVIINSWNRIAISTNEIFEPESE
jgi:AhpD family alkylhydroperoxidase